MQQAGRRAARIGEAGERGESMPHSSRAARCSASHRARPGATSALVFADEPTGNLDPESAREVLALLRDVKGEGAAGILVTHSSAAARTADRTYVLDAEGTGGCVSRPEL